MKRNWLAGFLGLMVIFGIVGCSSTPSTTYESIVPDSAPTKFEGLWGHLNPNSKNSKITFSGNSFSYQSESINKNGRFSFNSNTIHFLADTGEKWLTTYKISNGGLTLAEGQGRWGWSGTFTKNVVKAFHETDTSDASFSVAKQLRDSAAALFFYDGNNDGKLEGKNKNVVQGQQEVGGVCSDYAMELAYLADQKNLKNYVVFTGSTGNHIAKITKWQDAGVYNFRARSGEKFGVNNVNGNYDGVLRDSNLSNVKGYYWDPPHPEAERPSNHMWNIVIIDNRMFVIDATYFDIGYYDDAVDIIEVKGEI
jgi:hypothetical protein